MQGGTDIEGSDTDEDESSSPRADSSSADEGDDGEEVFYDATDMARSNSLQASRSGSMSLPAFESGSSLDGERYLIWVLLWEIANEFWERAISSGSILLTALDGDGTGGALRATAAQLSIKMLCQGTSILDHDAGCGWKRPLQGG